ncbi:extracellular solute-binding protein [Paenibacillaceae bacterium]|nr:extracellular solute-binding protein [Paenibacillaceae bacterium]
MNKLVVILAVAMLLTVLPSCQRSDTNADDREGNQAIEVNTWNGDKYDPPITLTRVVKHNTYSTVFKEGEDWDHNVFTKWMNNQLGIQVKTLWVMPEENSAFTRKLKLAVSREEPLPDIVSYRGSYETLVQLLDSGRFIAIDELFDEHANEIWKEAATKYPSMWNSVTVNGRRYGLPLLDYTMNTEPVLWIREDWMEMYDLQGPETIEDLERIMEVFTQNNPSGHAEGTYGLAVTIRAKLNTWMTDLSWLFGAYGAVNSQWNKVEDGEKRIEYGSIHPGTKQALLKLNEWMSKGYIPREANTWDEVKASELFTTGRAGVIAGPHWMPDWPFYKLWHVAPEARFKAYPVPVGPDGRRGVRSGSASPVNGVVLINKESKHPEAFFHYYNYMLAHYANPAEGSPFEFGFAEGYDFAFVDGELIKDSPLFVSPMDYSLSYEGARIPDLMINTLVKLASQEPETPFEKQVKAQRRREELEAAAVVMGYEGQDMLFPNRYEGSPTGISKNRSELLFQMEREAFMKMIYGQLPIEAFDEFVKQWKSGGGDELTEEVNRKWDARLW